jgi:hypothetical protein
MKWTRTEGGYQCGEYTIRAIREQRNSKRGKKTVYETIYVTAFKGVEFGWAEEKLADAKESCTRHTSSQ